MSKIKLSDMPLIGEPFSCMAIGLVGLLEPRSSNGSRCILTAMDYAMRYPEAVALPSIDTPQWQEVWLRSSAGWVYLERFYLTEVRSVSFTFYSVFHAMCNGLIEKFNGALKKMLKRIYFAQPNVMAPLLGAAVAAPGEHGILALQADIRTHRERTTNTNKSM